ncbi:MAG TPA: RNA polymerase sigma-70 factor [Sphingobacteriaceae bacterium]
MPSTSPFQTSEAKLLQGLAHGDVHAFEEIFKAYWKPLFTTAFSKLQDRAEAEEIVQNIFSALWEQREKVEIENLSAYLHRAVKNRILNSIRAKVTEQRYWDYYRNFIPSVQNSTENTVVFDDLQEGLQAAVNHLPEKSRRVFQLSRFEGRTNHEIAKLLKISEKSIEYHLTKSLRELRIYMKDYITILIICAFS